MRFVNTKRFSPVAQGIDMPWDDDLFHFAAEEIPTKKKEFEDFIKDNGINTDRSWWEEQENRCINGYDVPDAIEEGGNYCVDGDDAVWYPNGDVWLPEYKLWIKNKTVHITGRQYFYLNFWPIYGLPEGSNVKTVIKPRFLDIDFFFYQRLVRMFKEGKDQTELKGRQQGFSEKGGGGILGYNYSFVPNSVNIIVAGQETDSEHTFENVVRGLDGLRNTQFYKERSINKPSNLVVKARYYGSEIRGLTAKDKEQVISRYSPFWIFWEECGKWKKGQVIKAREFALPAQQAEGKKTGYNTFIATGGDMDLGADDIKRMHYNPEEYNCLEFSNKWERDVTSRDKKTGHFSTAIAYKIIDKDGNSDVESGAKYLIEQENLKKDHKQRLKFRTQHPRYASEAFLISGGGFFGEDRILQLNRRYTEIISGTEVTPIEVGRLEPLDATDISKGVKFILDPNGWLRVRERPRLDKDGKTFLNLYVQGTDSYDIDETLTTNSKGATYVKKKFLPGDAVYNTYVCEYIDRPAAGKGGAKIFYKNCAMISVWYNVLNLVENRNLRIFDWYDNNKVGSFIRERPTLAFATKTIMGQTSSRQSRGIDPALKPHMLALLADNITDEFINSLQFEEQVLALAKYRYETGSHKYNCDITIATSICEVAAKEDEFTPVLATGDLSSITKIKTSKFINKGGQLVKVYA